MRWRVGLKESVVRDLRWFGKRTGRLVLDEATKVLASTPQAQSKRLKTLRPNPFANRELRLFGKYRVLFNVDEKQGLVTILIVGEKKGNTLFVQGKEFTAHHESSSAE